MKRILSLLIALLLLGSAALAEAPVYSPALEAQKKAIHAMYEQYGFTLETLGVFTTLVHEKDDAWYVSFQSAFMPYSRVGQYDAVVKGDEVTLIWTHDESGVDHTTGDPACTVWGPKQIEAYLAVDSLERHHWTAPYYAGENDVVEIFTSVWLELGLSTVPQEEGDLPYDEARIIADAALADVFLMSSEDIAALEHNVSAAIKAAADGRRFVELIFAHSELCFQILIDAATGEVHHIALLSGGNG